MMRVVLTREQRRGPSRLLCHSLNRGPSYATTSVQDLLSGSVTACLDDTRALIRLEGSQTIPFLQGLVTNDVRPLETPGAAPVYAALLTPKGKFLHDVLFYREPDGALLMEVDRQGKQSALDWLARYRLRKQVQLQDVSDDYSVWVQCGQHTPTQQEGWYTDPRLPILGLRAAAPHDGPVTAACAAAARDAGAESTSAARDAYRTWRHMHGVAEGEAEIPTEKAAPLDYNLDVLQGVSYKKGCYIGQERNSFTHYRGIIRKRCMPYTWSQDGPSPVQGEAVVSSQGESGGTVQGVSAGYGLMYARLKPTLAALEGQGELRGKTSGARLVPFRPAWWDPQWGHEEEEQQGQQAAPAEAPA